MLVQPELAATLKRIAASGAREFYEGETAQRLAVRNGAAWRTDHARRSAALSGRGTDATHRDLSRLEHPHRAAAQFRRHRDFADAGDARRQRLREGGAGFGRDDSLHRRSHAAFFCGSQPVSGRLRFRQGPGERTARSGLYSRAARFHRSGSRHSQRSAQSRQTGRPRRHGDHALLDRRRRGERRRGHLHAQQRLRQRRYRSRLGLPAQRRNG